MLGSGRPVALRRAAGRVAGVAWQAAREYSRDRCPQAAAAISYQAALASVWKAERRPVLRAKAVDLLLVLATGLLVLVSFGLTILARVVRRSPEEDAEALGAFGAAVPAAGELTAIVVPLVISFVTFTLAYRYVPQARPGYRQALLGAVVATAGFELAKTGFAFYLAGFARYNVIYGSLGAVVAFLFFVYVAATVFLYGAEVAAAWPRRGAGGAGRR